MVMAWTVEPSRMDMDRVLILCTCSVVTASLASAVLGAVMVLVIAVSRRYSVNPDNVATPIAAALGDLVTLSLLAFVATFLNNSGALLASSILAGYLIITPICFEKA